MSLRLGAEVLYLHEDGRTTKTKIKQIRSNGFIDTEHRANVPPTKFRLVAEEGNRSRDAAAAPASGGTPGTPATGGTQDASMDASGGDNSDGGTQAFLQSFRDWLSALLAVAKQAGAPVSKTLQAAIE